MSVVLPPEQDALRIALDLLRRRDDLLAQIDQGTQQLRAGEFREYGEYDRQVFIADSHNENDSFGR